MIAAAPRISSEGREIEPSRCRHRDRGAENDDGDLDVKFGADRFLQPVGDARKEIRDDEADQKRDDEAAFIGQPQRPVDAEFLIFRRRHRRDMGVAAGDPAAIGQREHRRECDREFPNVPAEHNDAGAQHHEQRGVGRNQRAAAAEPGIGLGDGIKRLLKIRIDRGRDRPSEHVRSRDAEKSKAENKQTDRNGQPVFGQTRLKRDRLRNLDCNIRHF